MNTLLIFIACLLIMLTSLVGKLTTYHLFNDWIEKNLNLLTSFASGVFLVISYQVAREAITEFPTLGFIALIIGGLGSWLTFTFLPFFHHHHETNSDHEHSKVEARRILTSDAIHNFGDGVLLTGAFMVSPLLGWSATLGILAHELVQEISEFFVLRQAGFSTSEALRKNFYVSSTVIVGAVTGLILLNISHNLEPWLLGFAGGALLVVVLKDLIPSSYRAGKHKPTHFLLSFLIGVLFMTLITQTAPHSHDYEENKNMIVSFNISSTNL